MRDQNVVGTYSPRLVHGLMVVMVRRPARVADQIVNSSDDGRHCDPQEIVTAALACGITVWTPPLAPPPPDR